MTGGRFHERVAIVTGATRGIGRATAERLASEGAAVVVTGVRDADTVERCAAELASTHGVDTLGLCFDVADPDAVKDAYRRLHERFGRLDVLVNNAGVVDSTLLAMTRPEAARRLIEVNQLGLLYNLQLASRLMARRRAGAIVVVGSRVGTRGGRGQVAYAGTKGAVVGMVRSAALELAASNIRVNAVAPGWIDTDMAADLDDDARAEVTAHILAGRFGRPQEVASVIAFLASDDAAYVNAQVLTVDGGVP